MYNKLISSITWNLIFFSAAVCAESYPFDSDAWQVDAAESAIVDHLGQRALMLKGGSALLQNVELTDGIIEFDMAITPQRGFSGAVFRLQDNQNYEHFYVRSHQSGNPDANQYTPVFNGVTAWQLYHGEGFGSPVEYQYEKWMHVKLAFSGTRAEVYIDSDTPNLFVSELIRPVATGRVGINTANYAPAYFANFEASQLPDDYMFADTPPKPDLVDGEVSSWLVSDTFDVALLKDKQRLDLQFRKDRVWTPLAAGIRGITNLAQVQGLSANNNTVIARLVVTSDKTQLKALNFGYSDSVALYVNGTIIYRGNNTYRSRDYRYLGTIGLFDQVYLPLEQGTNEVWFVVSEAFGGWGIQAEFDDLDGILVHQYH